jgi:phosphate transport system protein
MTRTAFERELAEIQDDMLVLAGMVEKAIERGIQALRGRDTALARQIIADDVKINQKRYETEEKCLELIATQQPLASDLRVIVAVMHIIVDLERMGDHAEGIAKIAIMLADEPPLKPYIDIPRMAEATYLRRGRRGRRPVRPGLPRVAHLHAERPPHHRAGNAPHVGGAQPGAHRGPRH